LNLFGDSFRMQTEASNDEASMKLESAIAQDSTGKLARLARLERAARCLEVSLIGANELYVGPFFVVFLREIGPLTCLVYVLFMGVLVCLLCKSYTISSRC
jgi:hypothetical protein